MPCLSHRGETDVNEKMYFMISLQLWLKNNTQLMLILIPLSVFLEINTLRVLKSAKICHKWAISLVINSFSQLSLEFIFPNCVLVANQKAKCIFQLIHLVTKVVSATSFFFRDFLLVNTGIISLSLSLLPTTQLERVFKRELSLTLNLSFCHYARLLHRGVIGNWVG